MEDTVGFHGEFWERPQDFGLPKGLCFCQVLLDLLKNQRYGRNFLLSPPYIERAKSTLFSHKKENRTFEANVRGIFIRKQRKPKSLS